MRGLFITFEGADGAGKSTQLRLLADYLTGKGCAVHCTREPGGTPLADHIRSLLLDPGHTQMAATAEALLYMAARAQHVAELIQPALLRGEVVLCDRYSDSTIVYQGVARKLNAEELLVINQFATGGLVPDLTLVLDAEVELLARRCAGRGFRDRIEEEGIAFQQQVRQGFRQLAASQPRRVRLIDAAGTIKEVQQQIIREIDNFWGREGFS